jgi:hypothetical protein
MWINQRTLGIIILVVVIILIVIFLIHAVKIKAVESDGGKVHVHGTHIVTLGPKTTASHSKEDKCFYINGVERPTLHLKRGVYYEFENKSDEPIYFTSSKYGGSGAPGCLAKNVKPDFIGLSQGTIFFHITNDLPERFYYQSGQTEDMGGQINLW